MNAEVNCLYLNCFNYGSHHYGLQGRDTIKTILFMYVFICLFILRSAY
jgi:hypothetical protein